MQVSKHFVIFFIFLITQTLISQEKVSEKEEKENEQSIIVGLAPTIELKRSLYGINGRAYYGINESFCFGPEVSYFPYQDIDKGYEASIIDLNLNAHYIFEVTKKLGIYPLSGLNYTIEKERLIEDSNDSDKEDALGLNYGAGLHYNFDDFFLFAEFKGIAGVLHDEFITVGLILDFPFKK